MKSKSLFLAILFLLGTFVVPLNITNSYGDGILLFTVHRVAGSGDVNTENLIKERCFVHVQIDIYSAHHEFITEIIRTRHFILVMHLTTKSQLGKTVVVHSGSHVQ